MNNVKTISYKGKPYVEVAERVNQVHAREVPFEVLSSMPIVLGERVIWQVQVKVDGKVYTGSAEAKLVGAAPKSADATNPFECAETSALGRALAFAGFGSVDSIASFDEVARGATPEELRERVPQKPAPSNGDIALKQRRDVLYRKAAALGQFEKGATPEENNKAFLKWAGGVIDATLASASQLTPSRLDAIEAYLNSQDAA